MPVLMHGIMAGIFHELTRAPQSLRSLDQSSPRREGEVPASVTIVRPAGEVIDPIERLGAAPSRRWDRTQLRMP